MICGHKTRSGFEQYNIVSDSNLKVAAQKHERHLKMQNKPKAAKIINFQEKRVNYNVG